MYRSATMICRAVVGLVLLYAASGPTAAQQDNGGVHSKDGHLVNLDTPHTLSRGTVSFLGDARVFGAQEDLAYGTLQLSYGLRDNAAVVLRGVIAGRKDFAGPGFVISHGGNDVELLMKLHAVKHPDIALSLGVSKADTPAQNDTFLTAEILGEVRAGSRVTLYLAPKAVFIRSNALVGIGGGASVRLADSLRFVADITGLVAGDNTYSIHTGARQSREVWGVALRFAPGHSGHELTLDLGVTNGLGGTTGMSMTPGLSGRAAVYLGVIYRR